jgi:hypothetical protein
MKPEQHLPEARQDLQTLCEAFEQWRRSRQKRDRIPEDLWRAAVDLSASYPTFRIARALRLNYTQLKERIQRRTARSTCSQFVEVKVPSLFSVSPCVMELRSPSGFELRVETDAALQSELVHLISCFVSQSR